MKRGYEAFLYCAVLIGQAIAFHWRVLFDSRFIFRGISAECTYRWRHSSPNRFAGARRRFGILTPIAGIRFTRTSRRRYFIRRHSPRAWRERGSAIDHVPKLLAMMVVLQIGLAGVFTFALMRRLGVEPGAAWIGGTIYELGFFFASQAEHAGAVQGGIWLPLVWLCVVELRSGLRWFWLATLALSLAMTALAGLPQVAVLAFGSALALAGPYRGIPSGRMASAVARSGGDGRGLC